jgi:hypothetical protein
MASLLKRSEKKPRPLKSPVPFFPLNDYPMDDFTDI